MDPSFMAKLNLARSQCDFPWIITSGFATPEHNAKRGGVPNSWHMKGKAADIRCRDGRQRRAIVAAAIQAGIGGIEVATRHVHLDDGPPRMWVDVSR